MGERRAERETVGGALLPASATATATPATTASAIAAIPAATATPVAATTSATTATVTTATAPEATTAAATTTAATTTTTPATAGALAGFADADGATLDVTAVEGLRSRRCFGVAGHFDKGKAARAASVAIEDHSDFLDVSALGEDLAQIRFGHAIGQIPDV
jgi:hypothetical protein